jgi:hypothetical protein
MRKEIVLAIILGIILGGVIIFGINLANQSSSNTPSPTPSPTSNPPDQNSNQTTLQVISPENNAVSSKDSINLVGKTKKNAWVALIWEDGQAIIQSDELGSWEHQAGLTGGENVIKVTTSNGIDYQESLSLTVIYTTANIPTPGTSSTSGQDAKVPSNTASTSGQTDQVNDNLKQRIQEIVKDKLVDPKEDILKGYAGTIAKINDVNLVVNLSEKETLQVMTNDATDIIKNGKPLKITGLSIDEKIIIIGNLSTEDILSALRIVTIKNTPPTAKRHVVVAPVSNLDVRSLDIGELNTDIPKKSDIDLEELQDGQTVMAIIETDLEENTNTLLSLQSLL